MDIDEIAKKVEEILNDDNVKSFHYDFYSKGTTKFIEISYEDSMGYRTKKVDEWED